MEKALAEAQKEGCNVTDGEIAEHHYKLGRILWEMGGKYRNDPTQARKHLEAASLEESDSQVGHLQCVPPPGGGGGSEVTESIFRGVQGLRGWQTCKLLRAGSKLLCLFRR